MSERETGAAPIAVRLLEKEYLIACPPSERAALEEAAQLLQGRMRDIRDGGKAMGIDRIAVLAALNLAAELIKTKSKDRKIEGDLGGRVRALRERVDTAVTRGRRRDL